nr:hypothetical protein [Actinomycetota bacterium]
ADMDALTEFFIGNARRLGTAGKILFPIPNRRLSKRLYRLRAPTLLAWGSQDRYIPAVYADQWQQLIGHAELAMVDGAGHMVPYEQPAELAAVTIDFLNRALLPQEKT